MNPLPETLDRDKQILSLLAEGLTQVEIAKRLGITKWALYQRIKGIDNLGFGRVTQTLREAARKRAVGRVNPKARE
jgi:DNA-binding CsgD family transcriptional regulator